MPQTGKQTLNRPRTGKRRCGR